MMSTFSDLDEVISALKAINSLADYVYAGIVHSPNGFDAERSDLALMMLSSQYQVLLDRLKGVQMDLRGTMD